MHPEVRSVFYLEAHPQACLEACLESDCDSIYADIGPDCAERTGV